MYANSYPSPFPLLQIATIIELRSLSVKGKRFGCYNDSVMKILVIPDIHLKPSIFDRATELLKEGTADKAVCLMDIADDFDQQYNISLYERTYDRAIKFSSDFPETLWCYGNHDLSYVWERLETGFSTYAISTVASKLYRLRSGLPSLSQMAFMHRVDNLLFAHGGLTESFVQHYVPEEKQNDVDKVLRAVNRLGSDIMWNTDSPLWFRPQYTDEKMYMESQFTQVVGHTPVKYVYKDRSVISCDVFSTTKDGTPIGTCEFAIIDSVTGEFTSVK